jgi:lysostaphin
VTAFTLLLAVAVQLPGEVKQGEVVRVRVEASGKFTATMGVKSVPLFADGEGKLLGLMPVPVETTPGLSTLTVRDENGAVVHESPIAVIDAQLPIQDIQASKRMKSLKPLPDEMSTMRKLNGTLTDTRSWEEPFAAPVPGCMVSPFGVQRYHNGKPTGRYHKGLDQRGATGTPVRAVAAGTVQVSRMFNVHGGTIGIDHGQGVVTSYLHLSRLKARKGQKVKQGEVVGYVGSTGFSTAPHLHWSLVVHAVSVNPLPWLPAIPPCK